jgi:predicted hydrocarbon binding protein
MVDVEFRVVSDRREGLLLQLGLVVIAGGFTLLRQRIGTGSDGVVLTMIVRGPQANLLQLEELLATHKLVRSFEALRIDASGATTSIATQAARPMSASAPAHATASNVVAINTTTVNPGAFPTTTTTDASTANTIDHRRVESLLPQLARSYPNMFLFLHALDRELAPDHYEPTLRYIGQRVGAWVYKRDFALGAQLPLTDALRHIALPAMRQLVNVSLQGDELHIANSPFCHRGHAGACCHFLRGMLAGLLAATDAGQALLVLETRCRNTGAAACTFEFRA